MKPKMVQFQLPDGKKEWVTKDQIRQHKMVMRLHKKARIASKALKAFKTLLVALIDAETAIAKKLSVGMGGIRSTRGNHTWTSIDGHYKIKEHNRENERFGPSFPLVKADIQEWVTQHIEGTNDTAKIILDHLLSLDGEKSGNIDQHSLTKLRSLPIENATWERLMKRLSESIYIDTSKRHFQMMYRTCMDNPMEGIPLTLHDIKIDVED